MKKLSIKPSELKNLIKEEAMKIISAGNPMEIDMNSMDRVENSEGSAYIKNKDGKFEKKRPVDMTNEKLPTDVKMNKNDDDQGHDEEIAAAVKVDAANSTKKGSKDNPHIEGMKNSNFDSKKNNPSTSSSTPFEERKEKVEMNSQDKEMDEGAKTYVEAGSEITGREKHTTGQKKAVTNEKAPGSQETAERIAKGIELPESFKNKKELLNFINEQAKKISNLI